jgi:hypothetical protein
MIGSRIQQHGDAGFEAGTAFCALDPQRQRQRHETTTVQIINPATDRCCIARVMLIVAARSESCRYCCCCCSLSFCRSVGRKLFQHVHTQTHQEAYPPHTPASVRSGAWMHTDVSLRSAFASVLLPPCPLPPPPPPPVLLRCSHETAQTDEEKRRGGKGGGGGGGRSERG